MKCLNGHDFTAPVNGGCPVCGGKSHAVSGATAPLAQPQAVPTFPPAALEMFDGGIMLPGGQVINAKIQAPDLMRATLKLLAIAGDIAAPITGLMVEKQSSPIIIPRPLPGGPKPLPGGPKVFKP
jgi:hypothetical protein